MPEKYREERGRLIDAYIDGHKYVSGAKAVVYGDEDMVVGLAAFLSEIGVIPVLCASGGKSGHLKDKIAEVLVEVEGQEIHVFDNVDFMEIADAAYKLKPDFLIGSSKGYSVARKIPVPLIRVGFPIHDRIGGSRILHIGYRGAQSLFDTIVNTLLDSRQSASSLGYSICCNRKTFRNNHAVSIKMAPSRNRFAESREGYCPKCRSMPEK